MLIKREELVEERNRREGRNAMHVYLPFFSSREFSSFQCACKDYHEYCVRLKPEEVRDCKEANYYDLRVA